MIRPFSVFDKLNHIHFSDRQWFERESGVSEHYLGKCPCCGMEASLSHFGRYARYLVTLREGLPVSYEVSVRRSRCLSCRHTHATLPSCLVPGSPYSLRFILHVLRLYFLRLKTVEEICRTFGIAVSTLYQWKELFLAHKALWLGILEDLCSTPTTFLDGITGSFLFTFLKTYRVSFLKRITGRYREAPFCPQGRGGSIT